MRPRPRAGAALAALALLTAAAPAEALPVHPCLAIDADCTLREIATAAGVRIGSAAGASTFAVDPDYGPTLAAEFNSVTHENDMKWPAIHPAEDRYAFGPADALVDFARANDMRVRGHTLLWANPVRIPDWVNAAPDEATLRGWLDDHIRTVVGRYKGDVDAWDVVNEPLQNLDVLPWDNVFSDLIGPDYIAEAFRIAHEVDPDAKLFLNEVFLESHTLRFETFYDLVVDLLADGVPIHGVGLQGHILAGLIQPGPRDLADVVQAFADLGLVVEITEFDVTMPANGADALESQGRVYRNLLRACLRITACEGITFWGFTDAHSWIDGAFGPDRIPLPFDEDYGRKPAYYGAREALLERLATVPEPAPLALLIAAATALGPGARKKR